MSKQEHNNRSQGQRIRRTKEVVQATNEVLADLANNQKNLTDKVSEHDRDLKMVKARLTELEAKHNSHAKEQ
jgi:predicted RNase H-like nuclease (RuvC/YqgF family)